LPGPVFNGAVLKRVLPVVSVVLLTGCGVAGTQFHPGVAAQVGDQTITSRHVDQVTDDYCKAVEKVSKGQEQSGDSQTPMRYLTHEFATDLVVRAAAEQLADDYGVEPTSGYQSGLAQLEPQLTELSADQKDAVREIVGARSYAQDVLTQIGEASLKKQGTTGASTDDQYAEGQKVLTAWIAGHDVEINPKYAVDFGTAEQVDTDLSYALSTSAKDGALPEPDPDYTSSLPDNLVCLD
jgi:peptidyl-prolyl cis-trans isomerase SurA